MDDQRRISTVWISSSDSDDSDEEEDSLVLAVTPYSRITAHYGSVPVAKKRLFVGNRPPHNPRRELAIHEILKDKNGDSSVASKNVIPLLSYDVFSNGQITLDFPLMQTDLKEVYQQRKANIAKKPEETALLMQRFLEILSALEWIHSLGIIHRDVNPSNILLSDDLQEPALLSDFGISWIDEYPDNPDEGIRKYSSGVGTG
jgi:serine/threonine protein kinase